MATQTAGYQSRLRQNVRIGLRSPALWLFVLLSGLSTFFLALGGGFGISSLIYNLGLAIFMLATLLITEPAHADVESRTRRRLWIQLGFILLIIAITAIEGLVFHGVIPAGVPVWGSIMDGLGRAARPLFRNGNYLVNPVSYFVIPLIGLLLLGARPGEVGLGKGHRILPVTLLWCIIPLLALIFFVTSGQTTFERVANVFVSNFMQNGFFEEFLFRGALQSRLRRLVSPFWAVVISALIFGVWHLGLGFSSTGGNFLTALASTLAYQAFLGLAFGVIFERTRNLVAGSAVHVVLNTFGQVINA